MPARPAFSSPSLRDCLRASTYYTLSPRFALLFTSLLFHACHSLRYSPLSLPLSWCCCLWRFSPCLSLFLSISLSLVLRASIHSFHGRHSSLEVISHSLSPNASSAAPRPSPVVRVRVRAGAARNGATGRKLLLDVETSAWNPKDLVIFLYGRFSFHRIPCAIPDPLDVRRRHLPRDLVTYTQMLMVLCFEDCCICHSTNRRALRCTVGSIVGFVGYVSNLRLYSERKVLFSPVYMQPENIFCSEHSCISNWNNREADTRV